MRLFVVVPVYNEAQSLERLFSQAEAWNFAPFSPEFIFVQNGSSDESSLVCSKIVQRLKFPKGFHIDVKDAGIGHAYYAGIKFVHEHRNPLKRDWLLLTAADFPFQDSDLKKFLDWHQKASVEPKPAIIIGSKGHAESVIRRTQLRRGLTFGFYVLRRVFFNLRLKDTQGTFFLSGALPLKFYNSIESRDYFFSTELCLRAVSQGLAMAEIPVVFMEESRPSKINVSKDVLTVLKRLAKFWFESKRWVKE